VASSHPTFSPGALSSVFWGPDFSWDEIERTLNEHGVTYRRRDDGAAFIADRLSTGAIVGVFEGRMEFGPRALGHRSILSQATEADVNTTLNARLRRTEFMPFAPATRVEDAETSYEGLSGLEHAAEFMTVTCTCRETMAREVPAVVHVDGTARPQLVSREGNALMHDILTAYRERTGVSSLINTSFNVHEEPIVCSPADAIRGFLEAGLDILYLEGGYVVSIEDNINAALKHLRRQLATPSLKELQLASVTVHLFQQLDRRLRELKDKHEWAMSLHHLLEERTRLLADQERTIASLSAEVARLTVQLASHQAGRGIDD
jgi:predicted NodU family carbamoyl transferase